MSQFSSLIFTLKEALAIRAGAAINYHDASNFTREPTFFSSTVTNSAPNARACISELG